MYTKAIKPFLDMLCALLGMLILSPLYIILLLLLFVSQRGKVFFTQDRNGLAGRVFRIIKFRTMVNEDEPNTSDATARLTFLGKFLRRTSMDELPQLWNILRGEMSFIGPRPLPVGYMSLMSDAQKRRYEVRPGITGWTQVNGRHDIDWQKKFELDQYYVLNLSLGLDLFILFKTVILILTFKKDRSLSEKPFTGN